MERVRFWYEPPDVFVNDGRLYKLMEHGKRTFAKAKKDLKEHLQDFRIPEAPYILVYAVKNQGKYVQYSSPFKIIVALCGGLDDLDERLGDVKRYHPYAVYEKLL